MPKVFQVYARTLCGQKTLDDIESEFFDWIEQMAPEFVYLLGVWQTGDEGLKSAILHMKDHGKHIAKHDVCSSPFAIVSYEVDRALGGNEALVRFRNKLTFLRVKLILDFVPNHVAKDHPWTLQHPEWIVQATHEQQAKEKQNFFTVKPSGSSNDVIMAHGKDPWFDGWRDTAQLNFFDKGLQDQMIEILKTISKQADGVRCDMAMLALKEVFEKTWSSSRCKSHKANFDDFWPRAIREVKLESPDFIFMAEVYWQMESKMLKAGFDCCYDKDLYDAFCHSNHEVLRNSLTDTPDKIQQHSVRFLENHDEPRAACEFPKLPKHACAAFLCYTSAGYKMFHHGQFDGRKHRVQMQQCCIFHEPDIPKGGVLALYMKILEVLKNKAINNGKTYPVKIHESSHGDSSHKNIVSFVRTDGKSVFLILGNYSDRDSSGWVKPCHEMLRLLETKKRCLVSSQEDGNKLLLFDLLAEARGYVKNWDEFCSKGAWFYMHHWQVHVFEVYRI